MILLCGIPSESPLAAVAHQIGLLEGQFTILNQRRFSEWDLEFEVNEDGLSGWISVAGRTMSITDVRGVYTRMMDHRQLPEYTASDPTGTLRRTCDMRHLRLVQWMEVTQARVLNRARAMASNHSKPFQTQLIAACGFEIPPTLITDDPESVKVFRKEYTRVIYKSSSAVRSIVRELTADDDPSLWKVRLCPTQFQAYIPGTNIRVHVVGNEIFATAIQSEAADYRYAAREVGEPARLEEVEIPGEIAERCRRLAHELDLPLAGIDLKRTPDGRWYCFEVNPSPAFIYYEEHTGQPIARAIAEYLCDGYGWRKSLQGSIAAAS